MSTITEKKSVPILDLSYQIESLWDEINEATQRVIRSGQFIMGPDVKAFEQEAASYLGVKHAIGLNSGTDALVIALRALGIGEGDEVITTPFSFFATAESISNVGAKPVFVDVEENSMNINSDLIEAAITPRTKAIMPVHIFGRPASMARIMEIAKAHSLKVVEDCAQSFGATYHQDNCDNCNCQESTRTALSGKQTGTIGDVGAYSFFPTKNLGAFGDGGLLVTDNDAIAEQVRMLHKHGAKKKYRNEILGYNSRLDSLQAAILRVKLPHIDTWNAGRRRVAQTYKELLSGVEGVIAPEVTEGHVFHQYTVRLIKANRNEVQTDLKEKGIGTMVYYPIPQDRLPIYKDNYPRNPVSEMLAEQVLSLPIWPEITKDTQRSIAKQLLDSLTS